MPTHLRSDETATARLEKASAAGEQLEAGLAADRAERKRIRGKWERRHRRAVGGAAFRANRNATAYVGRGRYHWSGNRLFRHHR